MKKLISILLTIVTLLSALAVMPSAGAETSSSEKTTYIPKKLAYSNKYGTVYVDGEDLVAESAKGEKVTLEKSNPSVENPILYFYMRGKKVIYHEIFSDELYSIDIDGKNRKKLGTGINELLGGYGDDVIVWIDEDGIYKINSNGKKTKLLDTYKRYELFGGKLIGDSSVYDLKTSTVKTNTVKMNGFVIGQNHMYYKNGKNDLIQVDKNGAKKAVARNVKLICAVNNGATVVYYKPHKVGNKKYRTFYRKTKGLKTVKLCRAKDIKNKVKSILAKSKKYDNCGVTKCDIEEVVIGRENAYFLVDFSFSQSYDGGEIILPVNLNTGKIGDTVKVMNDKTDCSIDHMRYENGYIYYEAYIDNETDDSYSWKCDVRRKKAS